MHVTRWEISFYSWEFCPAVRSELHELDVLCSIQAGGGWWVTEPIWQRCHCRQIEESRSSDCALMFLSVLLQVCLASPAGNTGQVGSSVLIQEELCADWPWCQSCPFLMTLGGCLSTAPLCTMVRYFSSRKMHLSLSCSFQAHTNQPMGKRPIWKLCACPFCKSLF